MALVLALAPGCKKQHADPDALPKVRGSGVGSFASRTLPPYTRLKVGGSLDVTVEVGKDGPLELRGEDNLIALVPSTVVNGELLLEPTVALEPTQPLRLTLSTARLEQVVAYAAARVKLHHVQADAFAVRAGGAARLIADGSASKLTVASRMIATVDLGRFSAASATVTAVDFSRVRLGYLETLDATQVKDGSIAYLGSPTVTRHAERPNAIGPAR